MVRFKTLSRDEAKRIISAFDNYDDVEFDDLVNHWEQYDPVSEYDESFVDFRNELLAAFREGLQETNGKMDYPVDLKVGLKIYSLLPIGKNFSIVQANNDDFWRYISVKVMPDITYLRYPNPEKAVKDAGGRLNHKRFYAQTRRIWLKSLWWYVFLSWQGSELKTYNALKNNKTDNINKLIETPGRGYRLMLYRAMIAEYAKYSALNKTSTKEFAAFTKLNNAKCVNVEPALTPGGEKGYAHRLFASLCAALVTPGSNGENREKIMESPLEWWRSWKEMLGNKNIDPRIYDVLGELIVLKTMIPLGEDISWNGPDHASYDIEMESKFVEVKSTIARDKREVTISSHFQLQPENKPLHLVLCQFEPSFLTGVSIDSVIDDISKLGYNTFFIEKKLQEMGFENGMSSRKKHSFCMIC